LGEFERFLSWFGANWSCFGDFLIILRLQKQKIKKIKTTKRKKHKKFHVKQLIYSIESVFVKKPRFKHCAQIAES